jgi:hypothetical protein
MTDARENQITPFSRLANEAAGTARLLKVLINTQRSEKCCERAASCVLNAVYARTPNGIATLLSSCTFLCNLLPFSLPCCRRRFDWRFFYPLKA